MKLTREDILMYGKVDEIVFLKEAAAPGMHASRKTSENHFKYQEGYEIGEKEGFEKGYNQGYSDCENNKPHDLKSKEKQEEHSLSTKNYIMQELESGNPEFIKEFPREWKMLQRKNKLKGK